MRFTLPLITTTALLAFAPSALANTTVSIRNGAFGTGLSGKHLYVTDTTSITDKPMDVTITLDGSDLRITDDAGKMNANTGCEIQGAAAVCPTSGLIGIRAEGGNDNDVFFNETGLPTAWDGDGGDDVLHGGPGDDQMNGGAGDDTLLGGDGNDRFGFEKGKDTFDGQAGTDTVNYSSSNVAVDVTLATGSAFNDGPTNEPDRAQRVENAIGSADNDELDGSDVRNVFSGRGGDDELNGHLGDDKLDGEAGRDDLNGGDGVDTVTYAERTALVKISANGVRDDGEIAEQDNIGDDVENLEGGPGDDTITGNVLSNLLDGNGGDDTITGSSGDDTLHGDSGADILDGGAHNDTLEGSAGADTIDDGSGDDSANGGLGDDRVKADAGSDTYEGGPGIDTLDYSIRNEDIVLTLENSAIADDGGASDNHADKASNIENASTGPGDDELVGNLQQNVLEAGEGNDKVRVDDGNEDTADCGAGKDGVAFDLSLDTLIDCDFQLPDAV